MSATPLLKELNAVVAGPVTPVRLEYRNSPVYEEGWVSADTEAAMAWWAAAFNRRWAHYDAFTTVPVKGADGRWHCRFRRAWRC